MIRVLLVDDSATVRRRLAALFASQEDFQVVAQAATPSEAVKLATTSQPTLISLDVFLPDGNAAKLVHDLHTAVPVPIVLVSDAPRNTPEVFEALAAGALDLLNKPVVGDRAAEESFLKLMRTLSRVKLRHAARPRSGAAKAKGARPQLVAVAASTGGPQALRELLAALPRPFPLPVVIAQHLAHGFEDALAGWLSSETGVPVSVAQPEQLLQPGRAVLGRPGQDLELVARDKVAVRAAPAMGYHPSADVLFASAARHLPGAAVGVVLSGIGSDGLRGGHALVESGGAILAQDRESAAVYGMPGAVVRAGVASLALRPSELARHLQSLLAPKPEGR